MIVVQIDAGYQIINQQAHGLLAAQLGMHWQVDKRPMLWVETLIALTEHDDGQLPWSDRNHLTSAGAPLHFQIQEYSVEQCRNMIQIGLQKSRWNALMMSMHTSFLYEEKRGTDKALDEFLDQQIENQKTWRRECKVSKADAEYAYRFVQWCDALSLILCLNQVPPESRRLEISLGPDKVSHYIFGRKNGTLGVDPWPFNASSFSVHVETFIINQLTFSNDPELYSALHSAPIKVKEWQFAEA